MAKEYSLPFPSTKAVGIRFCAHPKWRRGKFLSDELQNFLEASADILISILCIRHFYPAAGLLKDPFA